LLGNSVRGGAARRARRRRARARTFTEELEDDWYGLKHTCVEMGESAGGRAVGARRERRESERVGSPVLRVKNSAAVAARDGSVPRILTRRESTTDKEHA
jgi:hypothetical protein